MIITWMSRVHCLVIARKGWAGRSGRYSNQDSSEKDQKDWRSAFACWMCIDLIMVFLTFNRKPSTVLLLVTACSIPVSPPRPMAATSPVLQLSWPKEEGDGETCTSLPLVCSFPTIQCAHCDGHVTITCPHSTLFLSLPGALVHGEGVMRELLASLPFSCLWSHCCHPEEPSCATGSCVASSLASSLFSEDIQELLESHLNEEAESATQLRLCVKLVLAAISLLSEVCFEHTWCTAFMPLTP